MEAALKGASEIGFTVISLTVSLIAVFIPLLFMSGLVGRMFREFALTLTIAVVTSAVVSLTLTPMMCSRLLKHAHEEFAVPGLAAVSRGIDRMVEFYHRTLLWVLRHQRATLLRDVRHDRRDAGPLCHRAEGLPAVAGHRVDHRGDRGRRPTSPSPRCRARQSEAAGGDQGRSRRHRRGLGDRRRFGQPDHQCRPPGDDAEAARRAHATTSPPSSSG